MGSLQPREGPTLSLMPRQRQGQVVPWLRVTTGLVTEGTYPEKLATSVPDTAVLMSSGTASETTLQSKVCFASQMPISQPI